MHISASFDTSFSCAEYVNTSHRTTPANMTHSNPSISSKESSDSESEVLGPWNELHFKIRAMFHEVRSLGESAASLGEWAQTIDPDNYRKMDPWPQDLIDAHAQYKEYVDSIKPAHYAYIAYAQRLTDGEVEDTCETRMKILEICLRWGEAALVYVLSSGFSAAFFVFPSPFPRNL